MEHERSFFPAVNDTQSATSVLQFFEPTKSTTKTNAALRADTAKRLMYDVEPVDCGSWIVA